MVFFINGNIWQLRFVRPSSNHLLRSDFSKTIGVTDNNIKTVFVADNLSDEMTERVICHELTHCICFEYGISIPIETEEWLCTFMSEHGKEIIYLLDDLMRCIFMRIA